MSCIQCEAGKYYSCVRVTINFKDTMRGRETADRLSAATAETRR